MRAWELLTEGEKPAVESDLEDLLVAAKANGLGDIEVEDLVSQLNDMGHSVTADSLVNMVDNLDNEIVSTVTLNTIQLRDHTVDSDFEGDEDEYEDEVDSADIAKRSAMKRVKARSKQRRQATKDAQI
jgi:hypothetical protein